MKKYTDEEIINIFETFEEDKYSIIISTTSPDNEPLTNYAPFVKINEDYYVSVSSNLPHFKNILQNKKAHLLLIEDEKDAFHIYARKRLYFNASCEIIDNDKDKNIIYKAFDDRFNESLEFIKTMSDFRLIKFTPFEKSLVLGFGAAYVLDENKQLKNKNISHS